MIVGAIRGILGFVQLISGAVQVGLGHLVSLLGRILEVFTLGTVDGVRKAGEKMIAGGKDMYSTGKDNVKAAGEEMKAGFKEIFTDKYKDDDVENLYKQVKEKFGAINGIIHSAGVTKDSFVLKKKSEEAKCVFASKISGTKYLDEIFKDEKLDFFVLFSSIAGVFGNIGQSDYSVANSFMDYFSVYRNKLTEAGQRFGKTLSVDWPLWLDGKMQVDAQTQKMMNYASV